MSKPKLLIIDDDEPIRTQMKWALVKDYDVFLAKDGAEAMEAFEKEKPPIVTLDLGLPPNPEGTSEGLRLLGQILHADPAAKVVVVTGNPDKSAALRAISTGAHDFFTKPIDAEELKSILKRACYVHTLESEYRELQNQLSQSPFSGIIGSDARMLDIFAKVRKIATTDVPVLITGESGTGKELIARAIHSNSLRHDKPFIPINCGAIPENLLESELFGHEKGAFTGAHVQRPGKLELADGGTLFLDEIAELPLLLQVKILRFLQDFKIERVGGRETLAMDVKVIAATNKDLKKQITGGAFREDLYYRLAVIEIDLPPLRERGDDVALLAKAFIRKFSPAGSKPKAFGDDAIEAIYAYNWPGNVRELENKIRRAITLAEGPAITARDIDLESPEAASCSLDIRVAREECEKKLIKKALLKNNYNVSKAAGDLGLTRPTLHHLIKKYNIMTKQS